MAIAETIAIIVRRRSAVAWTATAKRAQPAHAVRVSAMLGRGTPAKGGAERGRFVAVLGRAMVCVRPGLVPGIPVMRVGRRGGPFLLDHVFWSVKKNKKLCFAVF